MFPKTLLEIQDYLINQCLSLSQQTRDGRLNSAFNEDEIIDEIAKKFEIERPKVRDWVDFGFYENEEYYPVNIKVSNTTTADNLNCKLGIYYALTGKFPHFGNGVEWNTYFQSLRENISNNSKDYYFLIINKKASRDIFISTLRGLQKLTPNGNNLPFQAKWCENREYVSRTYEEAKEFILQYFAKSLKLRANAYEDFLRYFDEYKQ